MSYCRFSSDDWKSEVYCYESCYGGFVICLAGNKVIGDVPKLDWSSSDALQATYQAQMDYLETAERRDIELPYAGEQFTVDTAEECAEKLIYLRDLGYYVPQRAIDALIEESKENESRTDEI